MFGSIYTLTSDHTLDSLLEMFLCDGVREVASCDQRRLIAHVSNVGTYPQQNNTMVSCSVLTETFYASFLKIVFVRLTNDTTVCYKKCIGSPDEVFLLFLIFFFLLKY